MSEEFLERLSRFKPDAGGLDRDALLFATGRASARPNRGWVALAALLAATVTGQAQDNYPAGTVKFVLPSAPGSTTDILTRLTADALGRKWGKPTIVENISGGSMNIGAGQAFRAAPDGYTLFIAPPAPLVLRIS